MSALEVRIGDVAESTEGTPADVPMGGEGTDDAEVDGALEALEDQNGGTSTEITKPRFVDYLRSPIIEVAIGTDEQLTVLTAHEALLLQSPFFATAIGAFSADATTRRVEFPEEDIVAMGAFLEFLYTGEYAPRKVGDRLEGASATTIDDGAELLRHARVYTLAEKLGAADLKSLAHSKVHRVNSSATGEIAYARYVYAHTAREDAAIRRPIAGFWGQRSHVLRHEAEAEFRALCLEFPEFGFDVLSYVLDARERKGEKRESTLAAESETPKSGRKRARHL